MKRAVFLDRDGTLMADKGYLHRLEEVEVFPCAYPALQKLQSTGFLLVMVTNQSGIGRGYFTAADLQKVHDYFCGLFRRQGIEFAEIYVAPEAPGEPSRGRKPSPQFLLDARDTFGIDLSASYMVGDKLLDVQCGQNAGVRKSILVRTGYGRETEQKHGEKLSTAVVLDDVAAAADWILKDA